MNIFECCPKKPKMSLDYIIKWVKETDKTLKEIVAWKEQIEEDDLKTLFDTYAESYPWDQVPEFSAKADKVENAVLGHLASLDANGNLVDSGKEPTDFAEADHEHNYIADFSGYNNCGASISVGENEQGAGGISLYVKGDGLGPGSKTAEIDYNGIDNLNRALQNPAAPISGGNLLITNGQVFTALQGKADTIHTHSGIEEVIEGSQSAKLYADNRTQGEPAITIELTDNNTPGSSVTKSANIDIENIDNLNRALETPDDVQPVSGSDKLITSGAVYRRIESIRQSLTHRIETIEELFNSLNERVSNLENPQYSDTGIVITNDRYDNKITLNTTVYNELQIGDQAKVEIEYQGGAYSDTLYVTVVDKMTGPLRTTFDKDIYTTSVTGVTLYKRIS